MLQRVDWCHCFGDTCSNHLWRLGFTWRQYTDSLRAGGSRDRIPVEARFSLTVQTAPGDHAASCTMCVGSHSREVGGWVKWSGRVIDHPPHNYCPCQRKSRSIHLTPRWAFIASSSANLFYCINMNTVLRIWNLVWLWITSWCTPVSPEVPLSLSLPHTLFEMSHFRRISSLHFDDGMWQYSEFFSLVTCY